ncbi:MAG: nucleotidyltransferase family protein [Deltaproteobacteria bacterium]|nr:nucleotidyltransferase family protein [Deltaproteobacteria bacterium]MDL1960982.1 nucleotidyltransferase family protein [Deltaproteobacteria bacterium]
MRNSSDINTETPRFTAIVLAADRSPDDPVAKATGVCCKALTLVDDRPMVLRVLDALNAAKEIDTCIVCGPQRYAVNQDKELCDRIASGHVKWVENRATPSSSTSHILQSLPKDRSVLVTTADHALLNAQIVDYFCFHARTTGCDIVIGLARHELLVAAYPETRRTVTRLRDGAYCSCNLFAFLTPRARTAADFWRKVEGRRKKPWRMISAVGWMAVLRYLLGRLSLDEGLARISRQMGLIAGAVIMPFPEAAIDVDSIDDLRLVQDIVRG